MGTHKQIKKHEWIHKIQT